MFDNCPVTERLAWAAGLFDGEGTTSCSGEWDTPHVSIPQAGTLETPPLVLARFASVVGLGSTTGPHIPKDPRHQPQWDYQATGPTAVRVLDRLWPFLGAVKRRQADIALARYRTHPTPHPEIAAATGRPLRVRVTCRNGHSLEDGYWHRGRLHCRTCRRENHRARRSRRSKP